MQEQAGPSPHPRPSGRHHGERSPQGVLPRAKPCAGGEIIEGEGNNHSHREPLHGGVHRRLRATGAVAGREGT